MNYFEIVEYFGIKYSIEKNTATVIGLADTSLCDIKIPKAIFSNVSVIGIGDKAFAKNANIASVSLPDSVEFIGKNAFAWCPSLQSIKMNGVKFIDDRAFMGDAKLSEIEFSDKLSEIGAKAFAFCNSLVAIELSENVEYIGTGIFEGCRYLKYAGLPNKVDVIPNGAFYACTSLCEVSLSDELRYIDEYAFAYCTALDNLTINNKTIINRDAFFECGDAHTKLLVS